MTDQALLAGYLRNHWAAAAGGLATFERVGAGHSDPRVAREVSALAAEISADREALRRIMAAVDVATTTLGARLARLASRAGQLKPNGNLIRRSQLSDLLELEALQAAVAAKRAGWLLLRELATHDRRLDPAELDRLIERADRQLECLAELHRTSSVTRLATA